MPSSTISTEYILDDLLRNGDIKPVLQSGGSSLEPFLTILNLVMAELVSKKFNWKWNSFNVTPFQTISWQNDYAIPGVTKLGWLENGVIIDINSTQVPKRKFKLEVDRDLSPTSDSYGRPFQACWLPNQNLQYGAWGSGLTLPNTSNTGQQNPGPGVVYVNPLGAATTPSNPVTQIVDSNGNLQVMTTYGTCGNSTPSWPASGAAVGTTTSDGSCVWTVVDPYGQGFRLQMIPAAANVTYQVLLRAQYKPVRFTAINSSTFIDPVPDDYMHYVLQGCRCYAYQRSPEAAIRAKFQPEYALWLKALSDAEGQGDREEESWCAYPSVDIMGGYDYPFVGPLNPYGPPY